MIRALALILCATPAMAQQHVAWSGYDAPFTLDMLPCADAGCVATVRVVNNLISNGAKEQPMSLGPVSVTVLIEHRDGNEPDTIRVVVPDGLVAVPGVVTLNEGASVDIHVMRADALPLG
jgi:invasion protein IalB